MRYNNLSSAHVEKHSFNSNDHIFRETGLSAALKAAGLTEGLHLVREGKVDIVSREEHDTLNSRPSVRKTLHVRF